MVLLTLTSQHSESRICLEFVRPIPICNKRSNNNDKNIGTYCGKLTLVQLRLVCLCLRCHHRTTSDIYYIAVNAINIIAVKLTNFINRKEDFFFFLSLPIAKNINSYALVFLLV